MQEFYVGRNDPTLWSNDPILSDDPMENDTMGSDPMDKLSYGLI